VDARRLHPLDDTDQTAAAQIQALLARLPASEAVPLLLRGRPRGVSSQAPELRERKIGITPFDCPRDIFDAGYDSAQLTLDLADARVAVLVRLRADRCFYADPGRIGQDVVLVVIHIQATPGLLQNLVE
jgi:hypothetical protein